MCSALRQRLGVHSGVFARSTRDILTLKRTAAPYSEHIWAFDGRVPTLKATVPVGDWCRQAISPPVGRCGHVLLSRSLVRLPPGFPSRSHAPLGNGVCDAPRRESRRRRRVVAVGAAPRAARSHAERGNEGNRDGAGCKQILGEGKGSRWRRRSR